MLTSVIIKVGSGFCPFLCVRRLAECDASLLLKEEPSLPPAGGYFKKFLSLKRLVKNSAEHWLNFGNSPAVELPPYLWEKLPQTAHNAATPEPRAGNTAKAGKKNATMQGCCGRVCNVAIFIYGRDQNQYLPFFLVTILGIAFFASFTVRREIPFPSAARNTFSAMIS